MLGDMALEAGNYPGTSLLVRPHDLAQLFGVQPAGEGGRLDQVTKEHGELAAFGLRPGAFGRRDLRRERRHRLADSASARPRLASPDQHAVVLVLGDALS